VLIFLCCIHNMEAWDEKFGGIPRPILSNQLLSNVKRWGVVFLFRLSNTGPREEKLAAFRI
jgi:hypothetical protein